MNDIQYVSQSLFTLLFADDTNILLSNSNLYKLVESINIELLKISTWFKVNKLSLNVKRLITVNKLSLNVKKTNFITFRNKHVNINV